MLRPGGVSGFVSARLSLEQRAVGAYLGLAVGDALGATVEFMTPREIRAEFGFHDRIRGGGWLRLAPGRVTDDTEMALALGEGLLLAGEPQARAVAEAFDDWMRSKPVDIGNTVRRGIVRFRRTGEAQVPVNEHDAGNGALMRVLPVALFCLGREREQVESAVLTQARVTHNNRLSDAACLAVVEMVQLALVGASRNDLLHGPVRRLIEAEPAFNFRRTRQDNPTGYVVDTLRAVCQALFDTDSFGACLIDVVNRGGDADTTGAIAGMLAGALHGEPAIPRDWLRTLEPAVRERCAAQARALLAAGGSASVCTGDYR